jgi:ribonuclease R
MPLKVIGRRQKTTGPAEALIEEFMLAANSCVAADLAADHVPALYRNHGAPSSEALETFRHEVGWLLGKLDHGLRTRADLARMMRRICKHEAAPLLLYPLLRNMPRAEYGISPEGHYGLGKNCYCHFTSPIRRYPDLLVHQQLTMKDLGQALRPATEVESLAQQCNERETTTDQAAFAVSDRLKLRLLQQNLEQGRLRSLEGQICHISSSGLSIHLPAYATTGLLPLRSIPGGPWHCNPEKGVMTGRDGQLYRFGQALSVTVRDLDIVRGSLELRLQANETPSPRNSKRRSR